MFNLGAMYLEEQQTSLPLFLFFFFLIIFFFFFSFFLSSSSPSSWVFSLAVPEQTARAPWRLTDCTRCWCGRASLISPCLKIEMTSGWWLKVISLCTCSLQQDGNVQTCRQGIGHVTKQSRCFVHLSISCFCLTCPFSGYCQFLVYSLFFSFFMLVKTSWSICKVSPLTEV